MILYMYLYLLDVEVQECGIVAYRDQALWSHAPHAGPQSSI